jgi:hypothetical protein
MLIVIIAFSLVVWPGHGFPAASTDWAVKCALHAVVEACKTILRCVTIAAIKPGLAALETSTMAKVAGP